MIKNIVFDFGQVLVHFEPEDMTKKYIKNPEDASLAQKVIFDRWYWDRLDAAEITDQKAFEDICKRLPERLHSAAKDIFDNWIYNIPEVEGMRELILNLREEYDVKIFLLSNISKRFAEHSKEISILDLIDCCEFSAVCGLVKPDKKIFEYLCEKHSILPEETVFIDDNDKNIETAKSLGITTFLFNKNPQDLKIWLKNILK